MKTLYKIGLLLLLGIVASSCTLNHVKPSKEITTKKYFYSEYSSLKVSDDFEVYLTYSETDQGVEIKANDNLHKHIIIKKDANNLSIKLKNNLSTFGRDTSLRVYITTSHVDSFTAYSNVKITVENLLNSNSLAIKLFGDSSFKGEIDVTNLDVQLTGDSTIDLFGNATDTKVKLIGDSEFSNYDLVTDYFNIEAFGNSSAYVTVNKTLDVIASGNSSIFYKGDGVVNSSKLTGDSKVVKH